MLTKYVHSNEISTRDRSINLPGEYASKVNARNALIEYDELARVGVINHAQAAHIQRLLSKHLSAQHQYRVITAKKVVSMDFFLLVSVLNERNLAMHKEAPAVALEYVITRLTSAANYQKYPIELQCYNKKKRIDIANDILVDIRMRMHGQNEMLYSPFVEGGYYPLGYEYIIAMRKDLDEFAACVRKHDKRVIFYDEKAGVDVIIMEAPTIENDELGAVIKGKIPRMQGRNNYAKGGHLTTVQIHVPGERQRNIKTIIYDAAN